MKNVEMIVEGTILTIKVDLSKEFGPSASGKTIIIASTEGNVVIPSREEKAGKSKGSLAKRTSALISNRVGISFLAADASQAAFV
jgi:hypothetical protein